MSDSLGPHGLQPARLLCPWLFSRQEHWSGLPSSPQGDLPNPQIEPRSPAVQADSLLSEPPGKPYFMHRGLLFSISKAFFIENSRASCPGLSPPLRGTAVQLPHQGHKLISDWELAWPLSVWPASVPCRGWAGRMLLLLPLWREVGRLGRAFLSSWWSSLSVIFSPWGHTVWSKAQALCKALRVSRITRAIWRQTEAYRTLGRGPQLEREMCFFWGGHCP